MYILISIIEKRVIKMKPIQYMRIYKKIRWIILSNHMNSKWQTKTHFDMCLQSELDSDALITHFFEQPYIAHRYI